MATSNSSSAFAPFANQRTILLTTFRRDGTPVGTPVSLVVDGDRIVFRTWKTAGKAKRLRRNPEVTIATASLQGKPTGEPVRALARILEGEDALTARRLIDKKYPLIHRFLVRWFHRLTGKETIHLELTLPPPNA
jgi:PPOX class probable F420-dependent enzyme